MRWVYAALAAVIFWGVLVAMIFGLSLLQSRFL
jgi:hypothetical protein